MIRTVLIAVFLVVVTGCAKTPTTKAEKYVDSWDDMGMWLPDKGQIIFFRNHLTDVREVLISALSNSNPDVRQRTAYVIGEIGPHAMDIGPDLFICLKKESKRIVRMYLYSALAAIHFVDPEVIYDLRVRFQSLDGKNETPEQDYSYAAENEKIVVAAALYLLNTNQNRKEYLEFVLRWLRRPGDDMAPEQLAGYWERRWSAVISLESMSGASEAIPLLEAMLDEPNAKSWISVHVPRVLKVLKQNSNP